MYLSKIQDFYSIYITSFYWVIATFTSVGYGDITGEEQLEFVLKLHNFRINSHFRREVKVDGKNPTKLDYLFWSNTFAMISDAAFTPFCKSEFPTSCAKSLLTNF